MRSLAVSLIASTLLCLAQNPSDLFEKAPPGVEEALRSRISQFYQAHIDGKYRQAEALAAEDSKDFFYASNKPKISSFEVARLVFSDEFTKAKATVSCEMYVTMVGFVGKMKVPLPSMWKLVNGEWYWYVDPPSEAVPTPFGKMREGEGAPANHPFAAMSNPPSLAVKVDKPDISVPLRQSSTQTVTLENPLPGSIAVAVENDIVPGLEVKIDRTDLKPAEKATLTIHWTPGASTPKDPAIIRVIVKQTGQIIPVKISFVG